MINRLPDLEIDPEHPFKYDKLDRENYANILISIFNIYAPTGCVIALNGCWGAGKSTFIRMLIQHLKNNNGHPLYFNAWENDYVDDPLIAILSELQIVFPESEKLQKVFELGGKLLVNLTKSIIKQKIGIDSEILDSTLSEFGEFLKKEIEKFDCQKKSLTEFKKALQEYTVDNTTSTAPVVFFIDELDRCNPKFAIRVLERIKHLFDIPNIIFVLSINKHQLEYAIQGYFGNSNIDASNYLRRFIDIECTLPEPDPKSICHYLYDVHDYKMFFENHERSQSQKLYLDAKDFKEFAEILISSSKTDIRTWDKIFVHTRLALNTFTIQQKIPVEIFFLLCYLKIKFDNIYSKILNQEYNIQELLSELENHLPPELFIKTDKNNKWSGTTYTIAILICLYDRNNLNKIQGLVDEHNEIHSSYLQTRYIDSTTLHNNLSSALYDCINLPKLQMLLNKIELNSIIYTDY